MRRNFGLDALRTAAILIVLANHGARGLLEWQGHLRWGDRWTVASLAANISIEWLFVLSGFLIGTMMIRSFEEAGTHWGRVKSFWLRRWFRTVPNYALFLAVNALLVAWGVAPGAFSWLHAVFAQNLAWQVEPEFFSEAWTLALDEWFYLAAPLLVVAFAWRLRGLRAGFLAATLTLILVPMLLRLLADAPAADAAGDRLFHWDHAIRRVTIHHLDTTGWGLLAAMASRWAPTMWTRRVRAKAVAGAAAMAAGMYLVQELYWGGPVWDAMPRLANVASLTLPGLGTFLALPWIASLPARAGPLGAAVAWTSLYSYTLYLAHLPLLFVLRHLIPQDAGLAASLGWLAVWLVAVGLVSKGVFHGFEKPVSDLRERFTRRVDANPFHAPPSAGAPGPAPSTPPPAQQTPQAAALSTPPSPQATWVAAARSFLLARGPQWRRPDWMVAAILAGAVLLRWADRAQEIQSWDGVTFALATERYDMNALRPHAPGYPLFVLLARLAKPLVGGDANDALILVALAAAAAAVVGVYWAGRAILHRAAGLAAAAVLAASPVVYVHSVTANVYTADMACSVLVAALAWRASQAPTPRRVAALAAALALALGIRPSQAFFLAPVAAWGALRPPWSAREQVQRLVPAAVAGAALCLAWFLPMVHLSGGLRKWRAATGQQSGEIVFGTTILDQGLAVVVENLARLRMYGAVEWRWLGGILLALLAVGLLCAVVLRRRPRGAWQRGAVPWIAAWVVPGLLFYALVFAGWGNGPSGYLLVLLPGLVLAGVLVADTMLRQVAAVARPAIVVLVACACIATSVAGLAAHRHDSEDVQYRERDAWAAGWAALPQAFPPENTSIVALWNFAYVWWAFPEYVTYNYRAPGHGPGGSPDFLMVQVAHEREAHPDWYDAILAGPSPDTHPLPAGMTRLVLFDFQLAGENDGVRQVRAELPVQEAFLPNGWRVLYLDVAPDKPLLEDYFTPAPA